MTRPPAGLAGPVDPTGPADPVSSGGMGAGLFASAVLISAVTVVSRLAGFGRWLVFAGNVHSTCVGAAYASANVLPNVLFEVAAGGALAGAVVPVLAGPIARLRDGTETGRGEIDAIASALISWAVLVLAPVSVLLALLAGPLSHLLAGSSCPGQVALTSRLILVFAPQIVLYGIGVVLSGVLVAHRRFLWPAAVPLLSSLVVMAAYVMFGATAHGAGTGPTLPAVAEHWLAWGTTAGVLVMTLPLLLPVHQTGVRLRPSLTFPPGVARRGLALATAGISALLAQQAALVAALLLADHSSDKGAFPVFQYAQAVYLLPYAVLAVPLATSAFPRLAERASAGDRDGYAATAAVSTRAVVLVGLFGAAVLAGVALPVAGFFTAIDAGKHVVAGSALPGMGTALTVLAPGLLGFGLIAHLARALYALELGRAAATATATGWLVVIVGSVIGTRVTSVVVGLAWGNTIGMTVAGGLLLLALRRSAGAAALAGMPRVLVAGAAAAVVAALAGRGISDTMLAAWGTGRAHCLLAGAIAALVSATVFAVLLAAFDRQDLATLWQRAPIRVRRRVPAA